MEIIWPALAAQWGLSEAELAYIDRQQGTTCVNCATSLRSAALADAIRRHFGWRRPFQEMFMRRPALATLEINEAGTLTPHLSEWKRHHLASYPEVDMLDLPYADKTFDLVVHSDTLEHVTDPVVGLTECHRVLRPGGVLAYTIPLIVGRMSRPRKGMPASYHGAEGEDNYLVHTEYGADFWTEPVRAGFGNVSIYPFEFPAAVAIVAQRGMA
jgi:SAM-dependent methyltransferase